jgi:hypothetical protein
MTRPEPSKSIVEVVCVPSGWSTTAPARVGAPTVAIASVTAANVAGSANAPGSSAPSPHTTRSGGSSRSFRCCSIFRCATAMSSSKPWRRSTLSTFTWMTAMSNDPPSGLGTGIAAGTRTSAAHERTSRSGRATPLPHRSSARSRRPETSSTRKDTPQTPVTDASGSVGDSSCVEPS